MELEACELTWWDRVTGGVGWEGGAGMGVVAVREGAGAGREGEALLNVLERLNSRVISKGIKSLIQVESTFLSLDFRNLTHAQTSSCLGFADA